MGFRCSEFVPGWDDRDACGGPKRVSERSAGALLADA